VTAPVDPIVGDRFSVADHHLACSNTRRIRVNFATERLMSQLGPVDFAEINSAGTKITFTFLGGNIGWENATNFNN